MTTNASVTKLAARFVNYGIGLYAACVLIGVTCSWIVVAHEETPPNRVFVLLADFGNQITEPATGRFRHWLPDDGLIASHTHDGVAFDWSVMVLLAVLFAARTAVASLESRLSRDPGEEPGVATHLIFDPNTVS